MSPTIRIANMKLERKVDHQMEIEPNEYLMRAYKLIPSNNVLRISGVDAES